MSLYDDEYDSDHDGDGDGDVGQKPERALGFPAFPPGKRYGRRFADTWWGNAWIEAMEDTALDRDQLRKGRRYAFAGQVGSITVSPGRISASVHDGDQYQAHRTVVRFAELSVPDWDRFLDRVAQNSGHIAALLDRDMPKDLVGAASDSGVRLLPDYGDLDPECDCPGWDYPCEHAAALSYQVSWLLDRDPFALLLMRGRSEENLVEELHRRNARDGAGERAAGGASGTPVLDAFAAEPAPLPELRHVSGAVATADVLAVFADTETTAPVDPAALAVLVAAAADRATDLLRAAGPHSVVEPDSWADAVRLADRAGDERLIARVAEASGYPDEFTGAVRAWSLGGAAGLAVLEGAWMPPKAVAARLHEDLLAAWPDADLGPAPTLEVWCNRWTAGHLQLRFGEDSLWYPFQFVASSWWPAGPPSRDATEALDALRG